MIRRTVLAAVDFSSLTESVIEHAAEISRALGASLHLLHVEAPEPDFVGYGPGPQTVRDSVSEKIGVHHEKLGAIRDALATSGLDAHAHIWQGRTVEKILEEADRQNATLIVIGSHGHGALRNLLLGSVSEGIIRESTRPVLVIPRKRS